MKQWRVRAALAILFYFAFFLQVFGVEYTIIIEDGKKGVSDEIGNIIIPVIYEDIGWSDGSFSVVAEVTGYKENGRWGIISTNNNKITEASYKELTLVNEDHLIASRENSYSGKLLYGVLSPKGKALIGFQYSKIINHHGILLVSQDNGDRTLWGVIDFKEQPLIPIEYDNIKMYPDRFVITKNGKSALMDITGRQLTEMLYDDIVRSGQYFLIYDGHGKMGLIDYFGGVIIPLDKKEITLINDSTASVAEFPTWELLNRKNSTITSYLFDDILPISHGVYDVTANQREGVINIEGNYLVRGDDWSVQVPDDQFIIVKSEDKFGVLKEGGLEVLPITFDSIHYSGKHFYTLIQNGKECQWQIYSTFGSPISSSTFQEVQVMSEDFIATKKNDYWGFVDFSGHTVIDYKYDYVWPFSEGRAKVNYLGNQGILDVVGNWIVQPNHSEVTMVSSSLFINHTEHGNMLLDQQEHLIYQTKNQLRPHSFGLIEVSGSGKYGLIDRTGNSVLPPRYDSISELSGGHIYILEKEGAFGIIGLSGETILPLTEDYQEIGDYSEDFVIVKKQGKYGFIDLAGNLRIANRYDDVKPFDKGLAPVKLLGKWGLIDKLERIKIQPLYDEIGAFDQGFSIVRIGGRSGVIDNTGNEILPVEYDSIYRTPSRYLALVKDGKYGLASERGELLITPKYESLEETPEGDLIIQKRNKYGVIDRRGINLIPSIYEEIRYDSFNRYFLSKRPGIDRMVSIN